MNGQEFVLEIKLAGWEKVLSALAHICALASLSQFLSRAIEKELFLLLLMLTRCNDAFVQSKPQAQAHPPH